MTLQNGSLVMSQDQVVCVSREWQTWLQGRFAGSWEAGAPSACISVEVSSSPQLSSPHALGPTAAVRKNSLTIFFQDNKTRLTSSCSVMLIINSASMNISSMYFGAISTRACLADGVIPCCTTMLAREMFSSCILWQYLRKEIGERRERMGKTMGSS